MCCTICHDGDIMKMTRWKHIKSGRIYYMIDDDVINTTNGCEHEIMVTYFGKREGDSKTRRFARNKDEFMKKFKLLGSV